MPEIHEYQDVENLGQFVGEHEIAGAAEIIAKKQADGKWTVTVTYPD